MRVRELAALVIAGLAIRSAPAAAQRTGDRARLVFTVSGAFVGSTGLWTVPQQPLTDQFPGDTFFLSRSIKRAFGAGFAGTYYPAAHLGLSAEAFLIGLGYDDTCRLLSAGLNPRNAQVCQSIDTRDKSAASVAFSVGGIFRVASREFISPFVSAGAGFLFNNVSSVLMSGAVNASAKEQGEFFIYDDDDRTRIRPAFRIGVGSTVALGKAYHLRVEVRDNIVGIERVTGVKSDLQQIPPHENTYKQLWSVHFGVDVILERQRGRRY